MDIRYSVLGIVVGGSPAPGLNSVINSVVIEAHRQNLRVVGFRQGFRLIKSGITNQVVRLEPKDVEDVYDKGGSILRTSKFQIESEQDLDNVFRAFEHLRVRYLVTIGGTETAMSASLVSKYAATHGYELSVMHVPKTIFNDMPLPPSMSTFGYSTAREVGSRIIHNLAQDAKTMQRWYVVVVMGQKASHLALGIAKSTNSSLCLIPEEWNSQKIAFSHLCDIIEGSFIKQHALSDERSGVAILAEGIVNQLDDGDLERLFQSNLSEGHSSLANTVCNELSRRLRERNSECTFIGRNVGLELRSADPNAADIELARDLGFAAVQYLVHEDVSQGMITSEGGLSRFVPFSDVIHPDTGLTNVRRVDVTTQAFEVARRYMVRLSEEDMDRPERLVSYAQIAGMTYDNFMQRFSYLMKPPS